MPTEDELACLNCTLAICDERDRGCYFYKPPPEKRPGFATRRREYQRKRYAIQQKDAATAARIEAKATPPRKVTRDQQKAARRAIIEQLRIELYA